MKLSPRVRSLWLSLLCLSIAAGCSEEINTTSWKPFKSAEGGFSVRMPGTPKQGVEDIPTEVGTLPMHTFSVETHNGRQAFMVFYNDYPLEEVSAEVAEEILSEAKNAVIEGKGSSTVSQEQDVKLDGHPGKTFSFSTTDEGQKINAAWALYVRDNRMYQVALISVGGSFQEEHRKTFFDSFQFEALP